DPKDILIVRRFLFSKYLNNQLKCCRRSTAKDRLLMLKTFAESLRQYKEKNMISVCGCGLLKYLKYLFIIKKY
ncbi:MAG TPA: hypothetical protein DIC64_00715, partial [Alphaproteobacteria bacterium]|nr:hypothetical protein [Alphaproteobacteria bacterium]